MASYYLTLRAASDLRSLHKYSVKKWGKGVAKTYIIDLYKGFQRAASNPNSGLLRQERSKPFMMLPVREHFVIFEPFREGIIILTVLHQVRDIEGIILSFEPQFLRDIERLQYRLQQE